MLHINDEIYGKLIARAAGTTFNPYSDQSIVRVEYNEPLGGVVYSAYTGYSIHMHVASFEPNWINKDLLWIVFDYPFNQLKVANVFCNVKEKNTRALNFCSKIGFKEVTRIAGIYENQLVVVLRMHRDFCRWLALGPRKLEVI